MSSVAAASSSRARWDPRKGERDERGEIGGSMVFWGGQQGTRVKILDSSAPPCPPPNSPSPTLPNQQVPWSGAREH